MAGHFSRRMVKEGGNNVQSQIARGYEMMLYKKITPQKLQVFMNLYKHALSEYKKDDSSAVAFTQIEKVHTKSAEEAALKLVANAMLNIDEVITKN